MIYFFVEFFNYNLYDLEERYNYIYIYFVFCLIFMLNFDVDYGNYMYILFVFCLIFMLNFFVDYEDYDLYDDDWWIGVNRFL